MNTETVSIVAYMVYIICFETLIFGGTGYVVFVLGASGAWFLLAFFISTCAYTPAKWSHLWRTPTEEEECG